MSNYKLTNRGKFVLGLFILILVILIVHSGSYIVNYVIDRTAALDEISETNDPMTNEETRTTENSSEPNINTSETSEVSETTDISQTTDIAEPTEATEKTESVSNEEETIYSITDLEDLRQFKIIFYFPAESAEIKLSPEDLNSIQAMLNEYPSEKLAIEGHVNGYPDYESSKKDEELSMDRALAVVDALEELGVDKTLLNVYNLGSESPLFTDFGNQQKNDRVEVYFIDHYIKASQGK